MYLSFDEERSMTLAITNYAYKFVYIWTIHQLQKKWDLIDSYRLTA